MLPQPLLTGDRDSLEAACRHHCQAAWLGNGKLIGRVLGRYILYLDPEDIGITPRLCLDGFWESWITIAMARELKPGWFCMDIGANHGYYSVLISDAVGTKGRLLAVEPNPRLADLVALNLELNGLLGQGSVMEKAVTDHPGIRQRLVVPRRRAMNATLCRLPGPEDDVLEVETVSIDSLAREWPRLDLIKIDAEGAEESIWQGMQETLRKHQEITVIMEVSMARYADPGNFLDAIAAAGFLFRHIDYDGSLQDISRKRLLSERPGQDWMLFLRRDG